ncbi:MAG: hypothetical protein ACQCXQ_15045 [Verrucomicrobiales bacterium]|nr:hypothetical protein [Verrucomicrobiota bacterium JB025]
MPEPPPAPVSTAPPSPIAQIPSAAVAAAQPQPQYQARESVLTVPPEATPVRPEPRHLPTREASKEVVARKIPEAAATEPQGRKYQPNPQAHKHRRNNPLTRFLMLGLFLGASVAIVYSVLTVLKMRPDKESNARVPAELLATADQVTRQPAAESNESTPEFEPVATALPLLPTLPAGLEPKLPGAEAAEVLRKFLDATTLEERIPIIETKTPYDELATSCLAGPLPGFTEMLIAAQESNPIESVVDYYYNVTFSIDDTKSARQVVLLRSRGNAEPKVVADPFLDLFGGRLKSYASTPVETGGIFQVIAYPVPSCLDQNIPYREKKLTLKLLPRDDTPEIANAYFSRLSKIGEMLEDNTFNLNYGNAKACTVMLRWNTEDNPDYPYLEAIDLKALDWNP